LHPTEAEPEPGCATLSFDGREVVLSDAIRWIEADGHHVIRSVEFDVNAAGSTFDEALGAFIDNVFDFAFYLAELSADERAENEEEMFQTLAPRLFQISRELDRCMEARQRKPLISINLPGRRRNREDVREWRPSSKQRGSRQPSLA
jgi:hypothetical protein